MTYSTNKNVAGILIAPHAVFSVLATAFVGLRLYSTRVSTLLPWTIDDTALLAALAANHIMLISESICVQYGLGTKFTTIETEYDGGVTPFLKCIIAIECAYAFAAPMSKISVLAMYNRIFQASQTIRYSVRTMTAMLIGWGIATALVSIFSCSPVAGFWDPSIPSHCINSSQFYIGITIPNIIFDLMAVVLPLREVWRLQMRGDRKLALTGLFLLGVSVVIASIARLVLFCVFRPGADGGNNISQTVVIPHTASAIETCVAIIAACLPISAPVLKRLFHRRDVAFVEPNNLPADFSSANTLVTIGKMSNRKSVGKPTRWLEGSLLDASRRSFERLDEEAISLGTLAAESRTGGENRNQIRVTRQVRIERGGEVTENDARNKILGGLPREGPVSPRS